jgi:phospholipase/lecithinase/hemolysin
MKCRIIIGGFLAIILGGCAAQAGGPPPIREVVAFGDSLSDCGAFGFEPTTPPARAWDQQVARRFGYDLKPNWTGDLPGLTHTGVTKSYPAESCYAQSGARIANGTVGKPPIPGTAQLDRYLAEHGQFSADQLVTVYLGTNDILDIFLDQNSTRSNASAEAIAAGQVRARQAAMQLAVLVDRILDHGAKRVAVLNLYDLGESVFNDPRLSELTKQFNSALDAALPRDSRVIPVDIHAFFARLAANPAAYGFKHPMDDDACRDANLFSLDCYTNPARWKSPDADQTYILIGMVHLTGRTEALLADYVFGRVDGNAEATSSSRPIVFSARSDLPRG